MTEKQDETCEDCGHKKEEHFKPGGCQHVMGKTTHYYCPCKKFKAKSKLKFHCTCEVGKCICKAKNHSPPLTPVSSDTPSVETDGNILACQKAEGTSKSPKSLSDMIYGKLLIGQSYLLVKDVKNFIKKCEEIITRRCIGTNANCYEIKKEIRKEAGKELSK